MSDIEKTPEIREGMGRLRIVMNRSAMTAEEQQQFLKDLSVISGCLLSEMENIEFTTVEKQEPKI